MHKKRLFHILRQIVFVVAAAGLVSSLIIHLASITGVFIEQVIPIAPVFNILLYPVFIASLYTVLRSDSFEQLKRRGAKKKLRDLLRIMFTPSPVWLRVLTFLFLIYALGNIVFFLLQSSDVVAVEIGSQFAAVDNADQTLSEISSSEYLNMRSVHIRRFSGHWMFFYSVSTTILFAQLHRYRRT